MPYTKMVLTKRPKRFIIQKNVKHIMLPPKEYIPIEKYLQAEESAEMKSEYERGSVKAMSGGTINHGIICNSINFEINKWTRSKGKDCIPINGDVRIFIEASDAFVYPNGMLICGKIQTSKQDPHSVINPVLIVEVLSKSTESYDRGDKFHKYCSLPSFREYVLIDQYKPVVDVLYKEDSSYWKMTTTIGLENSIFLHTLDHSIPMKEIYRSVEDLKEVEFK
jgi:Uma2 family endonuclease